MRHCIGLLLAALLLLCGSALAAGEFPENLENGEFVSADSEAVQKYPPEKRENGLLISKDWR